MNKLPTQQRRKILFVASTFPRWQQDSTAPFVLHLAQDLQSLGWSVDVIAPHFPGAKTQEVFNGVRVERFRYLYPESLQTVCYGGGALVNLREQKSNYFKLLPLVFFQWLTLVHRLSSGRYDLLHSHWLLPQGFTGVLAAKLLRLPHVTTAHGGDIFSLKGRRFELFKRFVIANVDAVTVNSSFTKKAVKLLSSSSAQIRLISIGVAEQLFQIKEKIEEIRRQYCPHNEKLIASVGRIVEEKGVGDLIDAIAIVRDKFPSVKYVVIGEGPDRERFETKVEKLKLSNCIFFAGWISPADMPAYMAAADIFVAASKRAADGWVEAQGLAIAEAMMAGTPVVATRSGGIPDTVQDQETGLLVDEGSPHQIAEALSRLLIDINLAYSLSQRARQYAKDHYSRTATAKKFSDLYEELLTKKIRNKLWQLGEKYKY